MKSFSNLALIIVFVFSSSFYSPAKRLPAAPNGFQWQKLKAVNSYALKPDNWYFIQKSEKNLVNFFISKEDFTHTNEATFETGFGLSVFPNMQQFIAVELVNVWADKFRSMGEVVLDKDHQDSKFKGKILKIRIKDNIVQYDIFANTKSNTLYVAYFRTTAGLWDQYDDTRKTIMNNLILDPVF